MRELPVSLVVFLVLFNFTNSLEHFEPFSKFKHLQERMNYTHLTGSIWTRGKAYNCYNKHNKQISTKPILDPFFRLVHVRETNKKANNKKGMHFTPKKKSPEFVSECAFVCVCAGRYQSIILHYHRETGKPVVIHCRKLLLLLLVKPCAGVNRNGSCGRSYD